MSLDDLKRPLTHSPSKYIFFRAHHENLNENPWGTHTITITDEDLAQ